MAKRRSWWIGGGALALGAALGGALALRGGRVEEVTLASRRYLEREGGIQWYAQLAPGLAEAQRLNRPILFLAATPHCGGVPGVW